MKVYEARCLPVMDDSLCGSGSSDPYVEIVHANASKNSSTRKGTINPVYEEQFLLAYVPGEDSVELKVYDYDLLGSNDFMCSVKIDLHDEKAQTPLAREMWAGINRKSLELKDEAGESAGEIEVGLEWISSAWGTLDMEVCRISITRNWECWVSGVLPGGMGRKGGEHSSREAFGDSDSSPVSPFSKTSQQ